MRDTQGGVRGEGAEPKRVSEHASVLGSAALGCFAETMALRAAECRGT